MAIIGTAHRIHHGAGDRKTLLRRAGQGEVEGERYVPVHAKRRKGDREVGVGVIEVRNRAVLPSWLRPDVRRGFGLQRRSGPSGDTGLQTEAFHRRQRL